MTNTLSSGLALTCLCTAACSPTAIDERPPCGTGRMTTLVTNQAYPRSLALSGDDLYWTNYDSGELMAMPKAGGTPRVVASGLQHPEQLAVDDVNAYVVVGKDDMGDNQILAIDKASGASTILVEPPQRIINLRIDRDRIYWGSHGIKSVSKQGGSLLTLSAELGSAPVAVDDDFLYVRPKPDAWLSAVSKPAGESILTTWPLAKGHGFGFDMDEARLYFQAGDIISSVAKSGDGLIQIASEETMAQAIAVGGSCVYWSGLDDNNIGHIRATSELGDGDVVTLAEGTQLGASMAADESGAYWIDPPNGTITWLSR